jgi:hypothetical protein
MERDRWFGPTSSDRCPWAVVIATLLFVAVSLPAVADDVGSESVGNSAVLPGQEAVLSETVACGATSGLALDDPIVGAMVECTYCDQELCGCIALPECVLVYSCSCSPIECKRSCKHTNCVY